MKKTNLFWRLLTAIAVQVLLHELCPDPLATHICFAKQIDWLIEQIYELIVSGRKRKK